MGDKTPDISEVFVVRVSRKTSLNEVLGFRVWLLESCYHVEFLEPSLWIALMYAWKEGREFVE